MLDCGFRRAYGAPVLITPVPDGLLADRWIGQRKPLFLSFTVASVWQTAPGQQGLRRSGPRKVEGDQRKTPASHRLAGVSVLVGDTWIEHVTPAV